MDGERGDFFGVDVQVEQFGHQVNCKEKNNNYSHQEDLFLCRAWMATSADPIKGKDQSLTKFWERVGEVYVSMIADNYHPRSGQALPQRWNKIRTGVSKFCAIYKNIDDLNPSGNNEQVKINKAVIVYENEAKEKFKFLHCWAEVRLSPKWNHEVISGVKPRNASMNSQPLVGEQISVDDIDDDRMPTAPLERPEGRKLAKLNARKRKSNDGRGESSIEQHLTRSHTIMQECHNEKLAKMEKMIELEQEKSDTKKMLLNINTYDDDQREYIAIRHKQILERLRVHQSPTI